MAESDKNGIISMISKHIFVETEHPLTVRRGLILVNSGLINSIPVD